MRRLQLLEIEDQAWCPGFLREGVTDYLRHVITAGNAYGPVVPRLAAALKRSGARQVVDLCSGGGGPWPALRDALEASGAPVEVTLTDLHPNAPALRQAEGPGVRAAREPVDALGVPAELEGFRILFSSFHHFPPDRARRLLEDAVRQGEGIGIFEGTRRHPGLILATLLLPLIVWLVTPAIRPFRFSRLFWTYLVPFIPLAVWFDGTVSCLRTYTPAELRRMVDELGETGYVWEIGEERGKAPVPVTYLIGYRRKAAVRR